MSTRKRDPEGRIPESLFYTQSHEWVRPEDTTAQVGITDYAQKAMGDIVFVELPSAGERLRKGKAFCVVESVKAAEDIYAPLSGEVKETNKELVDDPERVNRDPYGEGWFVRIHIQDSKELKDLMAAAAYRKHLKGQSHDS